MSRLVSSRKTDRGRTARAALGVVVVSAALTGGCVILPMEGRQLVSDVNQIQIDVSRVQTNLRDSHQVLSTTQETLREQNRAEFTQLRDRLIELDLRMARIEDALARIEGQLGGAPAAASRASRSAPARVGPSPRSVAVTTGGLTLSASEMLRAATELLVKQRPQEAQLLFEAILRQFPDSEVAADAQMGVGEALEDQGMHREALEAYLATPARYPASERGAEARFRAAMCARQLGDRMRALRLLNEILVANPNYPGMPHVRAAIRDLGGQP